MLRIFKTPPLNSSAHGLCLEVRNASFSKLITYKRATWGEGYKSLLCVSVCKCVLCTLNSSEFQDKGWFSTTPVSRPAQGTKINKTTYAGIMET